MATMPFWTLPGATMKGRGSGEMGFHHYSLVGQRDNDGFSLQLRTIDHLRNLTELISSRIVG